MVRQIKGKYSGGIVVPLEEIDLDEGEEVVIAVSDEPSLERRRSALRASAGAWRGLNNPDELIRNIYASRLIPSRPEPKL